MAQIDRAAAVRAALRVLVAERGFDRPRRVVVGNCA